MAGLQVQHYLRSTAQDRQGVLFPHPSGGRAGLSHLTILKEDVMQIVETHELVPSCHRPEVVETSELVPTCHA